MPGDRVVDIGCGMGYFTIPMAKLVQKKGKVIAVDMQSRMLASLRKRANQAGVGEQIELHQSTQDQLGIIGPVDFVLAFWMVHEVHQPRSFFDQIGQMLKDDGLLLIAEPYIHVSRKAFQKTVAEVEAVGFSIIEQLRIGFSRSILVQKE
jgi:2-polyprenyl-3-methyl-5-hydroxy-6-metoxy-1,4-benzoquinol methylase